MRTKTSPGPGSGIGSWRSCSGAVPTSAVRAKTIAFIIDHFQKIGPMMNNNALEIHQVLKKSAFSPAQPRRAKTRHSAGKAAGESQPEAYPLGYVKDCEEPRTQLAGFFSILLGFRLD